MTRSPKKIDKDMLDRELKLIRTSIECPECGGPTGNLEGKIKFTCEYCDETFDVGTVDETSKEHFSYKKLLVLSETQFKNIELAGRFDRPFISDEFVPTPDLDGTFSIFIREVEIEPVFLLLASIGMGKTWNAVHLGIKSRKDNVAIPFFIPLQYGFMDELRAIFPNSTGNLITDIEKVAQICVEQHNKCLLLIFDGLDEIVFSQDTSKMFFNFLRRLLRKCGHNIRILITDRTADWKQAALNANIETYICKNPSLKEFSRKRVLPTGVSYQLEGFTDAQLTNAILKYGLVRTEFPEALFELCHHPFILQIIREYGEYPDPSNGEEFYSVFYCDDIRRPSILKRMNLIDNDSLHMIAQLLLIFKEPSAMLSYGVLSEIKSRFREKWRALVLSGILLEEGRGLSTTYRFKKEYQPALHVFGVKQGIYDAEARRKKRRN